MDSSKKEDLRVRRTKKLLVQSLFTLLEKQSFQAISVKEICDNAMIHRTTFYTHFTDKYDLMYYGLKDIIDEFQFVNGKLQENQMKLFRIAIKYRVLFSQLLTEDKDSLSYMIMNEMNKGMQQSIQPNNKATNVSSEIARAALLSASIGVLNWWLNQGQDINEKEVNEEMKKIFNWDYIEKFHTVPPEKNEYK